MQLSQKQLKPALEKLPLINIIENELNGMMFIQQEISEKSQNLEELFDYLTDNKQGEVNSKNLNIRLHKNVNGTNPNKNFKKSLKKKPSRRQDNTISSNTVRLLKLCIKQTFLEERQIYESFTKFFSLHSIRSQIWAFDAILIYALYMRDETAQIDNKLFQRLSGLILERLVMIEYRANYQLIKERIARYRSHCQLYFHENRSFRKLSQMEDEMHDFFSSLISKKKLVISHCMDLIKKIIRSIENQQFDGKISQKVQKTRKTRSKSQRAK